MSAIPANANDGKNMLVSVNEATLLRDVLVRETRALGALYAVGRRKPITELTQEQQEKIREAYRETKWASDYCVDLLGIYTSRQLAEQACKERGPNYFFTKLPIDNCLGDEAVFGDWAHQFPGSDATQLYENMQSATVAMPVSQLRVLEDEALRLLSIIKSARDSLTTSP